MENCESKILFPDREHVCSRLYELADEEYRVFHSRLCPGTEGILGVRTPVLRKYAGELIGAYGPQAACNMYTLQFSADGRENQAAEYYYEEKLLTGLLLGLWKVPDPQALEQKLEQFLPLIDNWAVCDMTCSGLKYIGKHQEYFYPLLKSWLQNGETYTVRFGVVLLMDYYAEERYLSELLSLYEQIHHGDYYVKMAVAWAYSVLLVKFYEPVFAFLKTCSLDPATFGKTIQKACESRRISAEQKKELRLLKKSREEKKCRRNTQRQDVKKESK
ncbi:MAG: DNA alkylation repair protein [Lachnospiraceae bacterium]|nr:DNA alkylation repair protein [Lachnospiraceae bacterium]